ncbi:MAG: HAMP domain-containing sensor histidine kinase [Vicinamibacterales bacterium]
MSLPIRLLIGALTLSLAAAAAGLGWEADRFGTSIEATKDRLEREVRARIAERAGDVQTLAAAVAQEGPLIGRATTDRDQLPALFDRLTGLAAPVDQHGVAVTLYVPARSGRTFSVLAWTNGPGERSLSSERLNGPAALFVAPGNAGMRLMALRPVEVGGRRVGVAVAETVIAPATGADASALARRITEAGPAPRYLATTFGPVALNPQFSRTRDDLTPVNGFIVADPDGAALVEVHFDPVQLAQARAMFRRRALALSLLPLLGVTALLVPVTMARRRMGQPARVWIGWTLAASALVVVTALAADALLQWVGASDRAHLVMAPAALLALVVIVAGGWWWRAARRRRPAASVVRFIAEQLAGGVALAAAVEAIARLLAAEITPRALDKWEFVLLPFDVDGLVFLGHLLMAELALAWAGALVLATCAGRWRTHTPTRLMALSLWLVPSVILLLVPTTRAHAIGSACLTVIVAGCAFALAAPRLRRYYHHTTESMRLLLALLALLAPLVAIYSIESVTADRTVRSVIEHDYAPATARHPQELQRELERTKDDIDALTMLPALVSVVPAPDSPVAFPDSQPAFLVWSQTHLLRSRVISDVELYGSDRALISRFALNLPQYLYQSSAQTWQGTGCQWGDVFGESTPFGAEARNMLHVERGICDAEGRLLGGIVVHVASNDYQALPFVSSANPYYEVLGAPPGSDTGPRLPDLQVGVYGWSLQPLFTSGGVAWPVSQAIFDRLYNPGEPFWTVLQGDGRTYHVHFSQNRVGVYALGYPTATAFEHASRLAEITALAGVFFVVLQIGAALAAPLTQRLAAPLRLLFHEIRTSFYRKLFLLFVGAAVVPVVAFALLFGGYMNARFQADVQSEAKSVVTVARRVFEELSAAELRPGEPRAPSDDVMVWIRQVIGQDVNLFEGSELQATSQRDLFDSGLLPTRTPATVYQGIALNRLPTLVAEDQLGNSQYLVAAAPVPARGRDAVLTVPLAPRQRELERESDEFNRGVLIGSILVVIFAAALGASMAARVADPVARLTRATRHIAAGRLDVRIVADTNDELRRLVDDFNTMTATLLAQRAELARTNQLAAWNEMARQVAHEIKNPLTPIQLAAEHLQHVNDDRGRPLGPVAEHCLVTILGQVRLLRQIASEFSNFAGRPTAHLEAVDLAGLVSSVVDPYRVGANERVRFDVRLPEAMPPVRADPTLLARAFTNLIENAIQAMPLGGAVLIAAYVGDDQLELTIRDTGVGMDPTTLARAFEPYFSTKTAGSGLGLANARHNIEIAGGTVSIASVAGAGTTVTITLPREDVRRDASADGSSPSR